MCNLYGTTDAQHLRTMLFAKTLYSADWDMTVAPLKTGVFVRQHGEALAGQWGMIPPGATDRVPRSKTTGRPLSTNNARRETVATAWTFRFPWARGQRCLIPAWWYQEPYWGISHGDLMTATPKSIPWHFRRADGEPWALAGLWSEWTDPATGEVVPNYTMLTQNCDGHRVLGLMHRPDKNQPADKQDKRSVVPIERADWDTWLHGTLEQAQDLIMVPPVELLDHGPADRSLTARPFPSTGGSIS